MTQQDYPGLGFPGGKPVTGIRIFLEIGLSWFYALPLGSTVSLRHFKAELVKISKRAGKDLQAQGPAPRLRPEPDRSAPPALARSQEAGADREDAAEVLPGAFLPGPTGCRPCLRSARCQRLRNLETTCEHAPPEGQGRA